MVFFFISNLIYFIFILFPSVYTLGDDEYEYNITSKVANVLYSTTDAAYPCEIKLSEGDKSKGINDRSYHRSSDVKLCEFAERCIRSRAREYVNLYGIKMDNFTLIAIGISFAFEFN